MGQHEKAMHQLVKKVAKKFTNHKDMVQEGGNGSLKPKTPTQLVSHSHGKDYKKLN